MARIEVWYDETSDSDRAVYCVSLCEEDGEEIECISSHKSRSTAEAAGRKAATSRGLSCLYREKHGQTTRL